MAPSKKVASSVAAVLLVGCLMAAALFRYDQSVEHGKEVSLLTNEELTAKVAALEKQVSYLMKEEHWVFLVSEVHLAGPVKPTQHIRKQMEFRGRGSYYLRFDLKSLKLQTFKQEILKVGEDYGGAPAVRILNDRLSFTQRAMIPDRDVGVMECNPSLVLPQSVFTKVEVISAKWSFRVLLNGKEVCNKEGRLLPPIGLQEFSLNRYNAPAQVEVKDLFFKIF